MKIHEHRKLSFEGADFTGTFEDTKYGEARSSLHISLTVPTEERIDGIMKCAPSALFSCETEEQIERCAAAAKIALRAIKKT